MNFLKLEKRLAISHDHDDTVDKWWTERKPSVQFQFGIDPWDTTCVIMLSEKTYLMGDERPSILAEISLTMAERVNTG